MRKQDSNITVVFGSGMFQPPYSFLQTPLLGRRIRIYRCHIQWWKLLRTRSGSRCSFRLRRWVQRARCMEGLWLGADCRGRCDYRNQCQTYPNVRMQEPLTEAGEGCQVDGQIVLLAVQCAVVALQVVSVTGVLGHPLHLVATVGLCCHLRTAAL